MAPLAISTLKGFTPFRVIGDERLKVLLEHCQRHYVRKGKTLMEPGKAQTHALFLLSGEVKCLNSGRVINPGFPYSLHYGHNHRETLMALTDCSLFQIEHEVLDRLLCWSESVRYLEDDIACQRQYDEQQLWMSTLLNSNLFYKVSPVNLSRIFVHLSPRPVRAGEVIIRQGDMGDGCYFIKEGKADVTRQLAGEKTAGLLASIGVGRCFGEDALLHETVRNATVTMSTDGLLMKMEKRDFLQLLREPTVDTVSSMDLDMVLKTEALLLDVRTVEEYDHLHLKNAFSMPLGTMRLHARVLDRYRSYVVYCDTDRRSRTAASFLTEQGYRVRALLGGLNHLSSGHPLMESAL